MKQLSLFALADPIAKMLGSWSVELTTYSILLRLVTVIILTSIIGCERSSKRHSAGLRTFVLVSFSSVVLRFPRLCHWCRTVHPEHHRVCAVPVHPHMVPVH